MSAFKYFLLGFIPTFIVILAAALIIRSQIPDLGTRITKRNDALAGQVVQSALKTDPITSQTPSKVVLSVTDLNKAVADLSATYPSLTGFTFTLETGNVCLKGSSPVGDDNAVPFMCVDPEVVNGELIFLNPHGDRFFVSPSVVTSQLQQDLATIFAQKGLMPEAVTVTQNAITITFTPIPTSPTPDI